VSDNPQFESPAEPTPSLSTEAQPTLAPGSEPEFIPRPASTPAPQLAEDPVWSGWDVLLLAGLTLVAVVLSQLLAVVIAVKLVYPHASFAHVAQKPLLALGSEFVAYVFVAALMIALVEGKYHRNFWQAIQWRWPRPQWQFLALGVGMLFLLNILEHFLPMPKSVPFDKFFEHPLDAYLTSIFAVSLGPLMEELFFRGFLYPVLARRMGVAWGIFLTALPFGLLHAFQFGNAWSAVLVIFLVGVVLTSVRAATKSVGASFLVHVGYNGMLMMLAALQTGGFRHMDKAGM
jgi:uncharacterized protein